MLKDFLLFCEFLVGFVGLVVFLAAAGVAIGSFLGALAGSAVYIYDVILGQRDDTALRRMASHQTEGFNALHPRRSPV